MRYDERAIAPFRAELTRIGFRELRTAGTVDAEIANKQGTNLLVVNSVCGCAARSARPGSVFSMLNGLVPDEYITVFAGMEKEATQQAREYFEGAAPSSPQAAILKDGQILHLMQRVDFLGHSPEEIAARLEDAYRQALATT